MFKYYKVKQDQTKRATFNVFKVKSDLVVPHQADNLTSLNCDSWKSTTVAVHRVPFKHIIA